MFSWPRNINLGNAEYLIFDLDVPAQQACGQNLLAILRDERGVEYLADTHVGLNISGTARAHIPLKQFVRAGWSTGPEGPLDFTKIREIRVGWGGYLGHEAEAVQFSTSAPQVVRRK
jgi:hypothetical protein